MVAVSYLSYVTNAVASKYILGRSDIVSAIAVFTTGVLGNAHVYSRTYGALRSHSWLLVCSSAYLKYQEVCRITASPGSKLNKRW